MVLDHHPRTWNTVMVRSCEKATAKAVPTTTPSLAGTRVNVAPYFFSEGAPDDSAERPFFNRRSAYTIEERTQGYNGYADRSIVHEMIGLNEGPLVLVSSICTTTS